jgi:alpha-beta hydrolase superfamily lysophospholipase
MRILFLHGLESGPHGGKFQALKAIFGDIISPDCSGITHEQQRLEIILNCIAKDKDPYLVVGSSMGGLMALLLQQQVPHQVAAMVLCAPALNWPAAKGLDFHSLPPTQVIHGIHDDIVPHSVSLPFDKRLLLVDDDHRLTNSLPHILTAVFNLQLQVEGFS